MTQFTSEDDPFFAEDLLQMAKAVNYRRWQFSIVAPHVKGRVVEVGGGVGNFTGDLAATAQSVISLEPNHFCYEQLTQKTRDLKNVTTLNIASESLQEHLPAGYQADTLVCLNVLEHIQDDAAAGTDICESSGARRESHPVGSCCISGIRSHRPAARS